MTATGEICPGAGASRRKPILTAVNLDAVDLKRVLVHYRGLLGRYRRELDSLGVGTVGSDLVDVFSSVIGGMSGSDGEVSGSIENHAAGTALSSRLVSFFGKAADPAGSAHLEPGDGSLASRLLSAWWATLEGTGRGGQAGFHASYRALVDELRAVVDPDGGASAEGVAVVLAAAAFVEVVEGTQVEIPLDLIGHPLDASPAGGRYEVMFFLEADDDAVDPLREAWEKAGEAVIVVGGDGLWNCHVHTDDIGAVLDVAIDAGRPRGIKVTDLNEHPGLLEADVADGGFSPLPGAIHAPIGVVAVVNGPGILERFRQLGVQGVVSVDPTSMPTATDIASVVDKAAAGAIVVLPNHKSLVPIAEEVDGLTTKRVSVVPTRSPMQGLAAMLGYYPGADVMEDLIEDMAAAAGAVDFGEVIPALRDARVDGWTINHGDWLGVADGRVVVVDRDRFAVLRGLVAAVLPPTARKITVYLGQHSVPADCKALGAWVGETHPLVSVETREGGQALSPYLITVE